MAFFRKLGEGISSALGFIWWPFVGLYKLLFRNMTPRKKVWHSCIAILLLAVLAFLVDWPKLPTWVPGNSWFTKHNIELGLDLRGGSHLVYQADMSHVASSDQADAIQGVRDIIDRRVNPQGLAETLVQTDKVGENYRVIVELPGVTDVQQAIKVIGETPILEFKEQSTAAPDTSATDKYNAEAKTKAQGLLARVKRGEDFASLAKQYSEDEGSKVAGGDLGFFGKGVMVKPFEDAVWTLKVGQVYPELVQSDFGYHIIKKTGERQGANGLEVRASHILIKTQKPPTADTWVTTQLSGKQLTRATVEFDQRTGLPQVNLTFNEEGKKLFADITSRNVGKPVAIFLDGSPISIPTVQQAITGGSAVITGNFTLPEAKQLAQRLNSGALPVPVKLLTQEKVDATLGRTSVEKSLLAGLLGILLVAFFMIAYYRLPGLLAVGALALYSGLTLAIFKLIPITLSLAGIAGYILSIGMAVDANVLIFERLREELRAGKPLTQAIEEGFKRAWTSIRDSNVSSLITAFVLMWFGTSLVKGFAITLILGILVSMFSAITVTRTLLRLVAVGRVTTWRFPFGVSKPKATPANPS